jgi:hypothetical protein
MSGVGAGLEMQFDRFVKLRLRGLLEELKSFFWRVKLVTVDDFRGFFVSFSSAH